MIKNKTPTLAELMAEAKQLGLSGSFYEDGSAIVFTGVNLGTVIDSSLYRASREAVKQVREVKKGV